MTRDIDDLWVTFRVELPSSQGGASFVTTAFWPDGIFVHQARLEEERRSGRNAAAAADLRRWLDAPDALRGATSGSPAYDPTYTIEVRDGDRVRRARYCYEVEMGTACGVSDTDRRLLALLLRPR